MQFNKIILILLLFGVVLSGCSNQPNGSSGNDDGSIVYSDSYITELVRIHAKAWVTGNATSLSAVLHDEVVFAYPGRRLNKSETLDDLRYFNDHFEDTKIYISEIIVDGNNVAVEWQFATTNSETNVRTVVSDAVIGHVKDGRFDIWKEYLDGRVKYYQANGTLALEEGEEPYPWPLRN